MSKAANELSTERLRALRTLYARQLPERISQIHGTCTQLLTHQASPEDLDALRMNAHSLAGSAARFGFIALADTARDLESLLVHCERDAGALGSEEQQAIHNLLSTLRLTALKADQEVREQIEESQFVAESAEHQIRKLVYLCLQKPHTASDLSFQLGCFGYLARILTSAEQLERSLENASPAAVVLEDQPATSFREQLEVVDHFRQRSEDEVLTSLIIVSSENDLDARLKAIRAGADAYLIRPIDSRELVEKLEVLTEHQASDPYRILVADRTYEIALQSALTLQSGGMITAMANSAQQVLEQLAEFQPDLILSALDIQDCRGEELAALIRLEGAYLNTPIVFQSAGTDLVEQLAAIRAGGDDFLTLPAAADQVIAIARYHAQRARMRRYLTTRDSLTGLLNHTKVMEALDAEVTRARRRDEPMTFAILDIDQLGAVNEASGHLNGDSVIKSLSRLLQQRLRRSDALGRYGGDEFAIVLPNTTAASGMKVLDEVRSLFGEIKQQARGSAFFATFSCGVAGFPTFQNTTALHSAASRALAAAKKEGGNRVAGAAGH